MSRRKQHPLIDAMNKFEKLLLSLDGTNAETFIAYVRNKIAVSRPKSPAKSSSAPRAGKKSSSQKSLTEVIGASSGASLATVTTASNANANET